MIRASLRRPDPPWIFPERQFLTDRELADRVAAGDRRSGAELVRRHADRGFALAFRMLGSREDAEEAVQDAFVRAFRSLQRFEWKSSFATWFYRIVYNVCATAAQHRGLGSPSSRSEEEEFEPIAPIDSMPDHIIEDAEFDEIVRQEIGRMSPEHAIILSLFLLNEQSYDEIVTITGLPLGTVKNRLFRARLRLRDAVQTRYRTRKQTGAGSEASGGMTKLPPDDDIQTNMSLTKGSPITVSH